MNGLQHFRLTLPDEIRLACLARGRTDGRRVMLLHGFPEGAFVWEDVMAALAPEVRCVAPYLRGYAPSSMPPGVASYRPRHLVGDLVAAIEALGAPLDVLVAHDWGGALAWNLAAARPDLLRHLVIVNAPHPATFLRELRHNAAQQAASAYMAALCEPGAEAALAADDHAALWPFFGEAVWLTPAVRERYRQLWQQGLTGALNYYRASPLRPPQGPDDPLHAVQLPADLVTVHVPTTVLWGEADHALLPALVDGLEAYVPDLRLQRVPGATHWLVHEQPALVVEAVRRALG